MSVNQEAVFEPLIVAFCCNWCSYAGADLAGTSRMAYPANVRIVRVPCSSRVNPSFIIRAFQRGADGVIVAGCHPGDCHYHSGNFFTRRRFTVLKQMLEYMGIEPERFQVRWISGSEGAKFAAVMDGITQDVRNLGPNRKLRDVR
jgi:F420-non-reducing hydrogenase iron-sulfur subunit